MPANPHQQRPWLIPWLVVNGTSELDQLLNDGYRVATCARNMDGLDAVAQGELASPWYIPSPLGQVLL